MPDAALQTKKEGGRLGDGGCGMESCELWLISLQETIEPYCRVLMMTIHEVPIEHQS